MKKTKTVLIDDAANWIEDRHVANDKTNTGNGNPDGDIGNPFGSNPSAALGTHNDERKRSDGRVFVKAIIFGGMTSLVHFFVTLVVCLQMALVVPRYKRFADSFGVELTSLEAISIQLSDFFVAYWYLLLLLVIVVVGPISIALQFLPYRLRWVRTCWLIFWPLAAIVFLFFESLVMAVLVEHHTTSLS